MELGDEKLTVALFDQFPIRRTWYNGEWWYSIIDCMAPLSGSPNPRRYWSDLKHDILATEQIDVYALGVHILSLPDSTGRKQKTDCANKAILLRLIQSVKSPNAEPFKQWLADLGAAELEKTEDGNRQMRAAYRYKLEGADQLLHELVKFRGIVTPEQHQALTDANYAGLYDVACELDVINMRELPMLTDDPKDWMGVTEEAYNIFQRSLTASVIQQRNIRGQEAILHTAEDVGVEIRLTIQRTGGVMPEDLPRHRPLTRGDWVPGLREGDEYIPDER